MLKALALAWNGFWRGAHALALALDADPSDEIDGRIRRLEAAVFGGDPRSAPGSRARPQGEAASEGTKDA